MEIAGDLERPKSTEGKGSVGLGVPGSETKISDKISPPLFSKEREEKVRQANRESENLVLEGKKEIGAKFLEIPERPTPNLMIGSEQDKTALDQTNDKPTPEYKELESNKQEAASWDWAKKAWGKVAFSSPDNLYFKPNIIEKWENGRIYELLGVRTFQKLYDWVFFKRSIGPLHAFHGIMSAQDRKSALKEYDVGTRVQESIHVASVPFLGLSAVAAFYGVPIVGHILGYFSIAANFAYNFYPIIAQRYNRVRLYNLIDKLNARERKNNK